LVKKKTLDRLDAFHSDNPLKEGIPKQELRSAVPGGDKLFKTVLEALVAAGQAVDQADTVRAASHQVVLKDAEKGLKDRLFKMIADGRQAPPVLKEIIEASGSDPKHVRNLLGLLEKEGKIVRIKEDLYFSTEFLAEVKRKLSEFITRQGGITPSRFSEITGSSRKYNIPLLEYLDRERFTIRVGDQRVLRGSGSSGEAGKPE
jgi:selenocysteine-specific elongation factor